MSIREECYISTCMYTCVCVFGTTGRGHVRVGDVGGPTRAPRRHRIHRRRHTHRGQGLAPRDATNAPALALQAARNEWDALLQM